MAEKDYGSRVLELEPRELLHPSSLLLVVPDTFLALKACYSCRLLANHCNPASSDH